jgi:hypothetical protein
MTFCLLLEHFFSWTQLRNWQNFQTGIFGKTRKKNSRMIAMFFFPFYDKIIKLKQIKLAKRLKGVIAQRRKNLGST